MLDAQILKFLHLLCFFHAVCDRVGSPAGEATLEAFKPRPYAELVDGKTMAQVGRRLMWR
jgi:hypothetical protein